MGLLVTVFGLTRPQDGVSCGSSWPRKMPRFLGYGGATAVRNPLPESIASTVMALASSSLPAMRRRALYTCNAYRRLLPNDRACSVKAIAALTASRLASIDCHKEGSLGAHFPPIGRRGQVSIAVIVPAGIGWQQ
jgi:hypothetical protein